ncbi:Adenylyltransferase and sulfurtransferase MOCS3 [Smittium mucronatum]|uniref:Adenylyltransferase and sulfurtransferase MOCS3 n=1 Tax=Smittium mucronatum TaxID=133383 RepID=A0A1R0GL42_9FUNG|nr:Adenylyltransferase and sulfurtransferase MOCS3 [Smittium mucronatum]
MIVASDKIPLGQEKYSTELTESHDHGKNRGQDPRKYFLTTFSVFGNPQFRQFRIRGRREDCEVCGLDPSILKLIDYVQFCGSSATDAPIELKVLEEKDPNRISAMEYSKIRKSNKRHILLDVREKSQFDLCSIKGSVHIPIKPILDEEASKEKGASEETPPNELTKLAVQATEEEQPIFVICRRGNLSQLAVKELRRLGFENCYQIDGGLTSWQRSVDSSFPSY